MINKTKQYMFLFKDFGSAAKFLLDAEEVYQAPYVIGILDTENDKVQMSCHYLFDNQSDEDRLSAFIINYYHSDPKFLYFKDYMTRSFIDDIDVPSFNVQEDLDMFMKVMFISTKINFTTLRDPLAVALYLRKLNIKLLKIINIYQDNIEFQITMIKDKFSLHESRKVFQNIIKQNIANMGLLSTNKFVTT